MYLCNRKSEMTAMVPWMSGLVNGLQNRLRRFESARHLTRSNQQQLVAFFIFIYHLILFNPFFWLSGNLVGISINLCKSI